MRGPCGNDFLQQQGGNVCAHTKKVFFRAVNRKFDLKKGWLACKIDHVCSALYYLLRRFRNMDEKQS